MKKIFTLLFVCCFIFAKSQFTNTLTYLGYFTKDTISTILAGQGIPSGIFNVAYDVKAYRVLYNTVKADSTPITASGLLCVPVNPPCKVGIVSYQHGTTLQKNGAPSFLSGNEWFIPLIGAAVGYDAMAPDYLGLGTGPGFHPYQHAHTEATATIDLIRAAKELVDSLGAPYNDQLFLLGYSQGGHATMATHQLIQEQLDNVMHVTASAPMSGAYDMSGVMGDLLTSNQPYPAPFYLPYLIFGYQSVYHLFANDSDVMIAPYDTTLQPLFNGLIPESTVDNAMPHSGIPVQIMQPYQVDSFVNDSTTNFFRVKLMENNTYNWLPNSPMKMFFCTGDHYVPHANTTVAYNHFLGLGATNIDTVDIGPYEHQACAPYAILNSVQWFQSLTYHPLSATVSSNPNTSLASPNGVAIAHPSQGEGPYTYVWSNGATTDTVSNLAAGAFAVTITDKNLCTTSDSVHVQFVNGLQEQVLTNVKVYPNPSKGVIYIENTDPSDNIKQPQVYDMQGRLINTYTVTQGNIIQLYFAEAAQGIYYVRLNSISGKSLVSKVTILE
jgi:Secretion system C-terminal sorting domain/Secretory lipase